MTNPSGGLAAVVPAPRKRRLAVLFVLLLGATPALAHKLNVFAAADGASIEGSAYFAGGAKATGAKILITDAAGKVLAELDPAADGRFSYQASAPVEHRIIAETADGHRAEWRVTAEELAGGFPSVPVDAQNADADVSGTVPAKVAPHAVDDGEAAANAAAQVPGLETMIEVAVARQIRPLREELLATRDALRLSDILGGIGYIFGLAGLAIWWHSRRSRGPR